MCQVRMHDSYFEGRRTPFPSEDPAGLPLTWLERIERRIELWRARWIMRKQGRKAIQF